jgi:preprotein translocase subunit SecF
LFIGLGVGIVAICLFVFDWLRYNIFAGLSFLLAYLHNIILYISILIITRVQISLVSLSVGLILTLIMGAVLISIYEKNREKVKLHLSDKLSVSERMIESEKQAVLPYGFIFIGMLVFAALMFFIPVSSVRLSAVNIIIALVVTAYTSLIIGPGSYAALLEIRDLSQKAVLSRNHTINKEIKKKIKKNTTKKV